MRAAAPPVGVIDSILARLARLEQQAAPPSSEQLQPNYLTVDPSGRIGATFSGHVKAQGVDLPQAGGTPLVPVSALDWLDAAGNVQEFIQGSATNTLELSATPNGDSALRISSGQLLISLPTVGSVDLLDDSGASGFVQIAGAPDRIAVQVFSADAAVTAAPPWSPVTVNFPAAFPIGTTVVLYSIQPTGGTSSITSSELFGFTASTVTLDINSTINQTVTLYILALGQ